MVSLLLKWHNTIYILKSNLLQIAAFAVLCLAQLSYGQFYNSGFNSGFQTRPSIYGRKISNPIVSVGGNSITNYAQPRMNLRPEDEAAVNALGPNGIATGTQSLNIATELVKGVFPQSGPIIQNGAVQTKWGPYALPASMLQDQEVIEKLLQATRDMINKMPMAE